MDVTGKTIVVTGAAHGIGAALCRRFAAENAAHVVVSDIDQEAAIALAAEINGTAIGCDVSSEADIQNLVQQTEASCGPIDVFFSNAGITVKGGLETANDDWQTMWDVNVMSRLYAARAVMPGMLERGSGYLIHTASGAGLLTEIGSASYSATKHADVALAEWLSVTYGRQGIAVSTVCPLGVKTDFLDEEDPIHQFLHMNAVTAEDVAEAVIQGMKKEQFLILPHADVAEYITMKADNHDRFIRGFQRLKQKLTKKLSKKKKNDAA